VACADDIPVAHTPPGGWTTLPPPVLAGCDEPLARGAPDLRGLWRVVAVDVGGAPAPADHPIHCHVERIEQCGDRVVVTAAGVIHDMRCDGTVERGVDDVAAGRARARIRVVATFEDGVHMLRPVGLPGVEVTRRRDGAHVVWQYGAAFTARLARVAEPDAAGR
jgi:hypothetical protein